MAGAYPLPDDGAVADRRGTERRAARYPEVLQGRAPHSRGRDRRQDPDPAGRVQGAEEWEREHQGSDTRHSDMHGGQCRYAGEHSCPHVLDVGSVGVQWTVLSHVHRGYYRTRL